jgi:hypothetical protein
LALLGLVQRIWRSASRSGAWRSRSRRLQRSRRRR